MDSLSIFFLFDSLLNTPTRPSSELNIRMSYSNNMVTAGRNYGINQQSFSPGLSFYHRSGIYADYSGFITTTTDPAYNMSMASLGYLGTIGEKWNYNASYEHWVYHDEQAESNLSNSLGLSATFNTKLAYGTVDYSFLFGHETAHRIIGGLTGNIAFGEVWIFKSFSLLPTINVIFGNDDITLYRISETDRNRRLLTIFELSREDILELYEQGLIGQGEMREFLRTRRLSTSSELSTEQEERLTEILKGLEQQENVFGLMNYSFSLPLMMTTGKFSFLISYSYSVPVALPGEDFSMEAIGYLGAAITYRIPFKE